MADGGVSVGRRAPIILIIEDNRSVAEMLVAVLGAVGFDTMVACTGAAAVEALATARPAVVLLDLHLPDMHGGAILRTIRADARFAKPLDRELILRLAATHKLLITIEEGAAGGFGAHVLTLLSDAGALEHGLKVRTMTLPDKFQDHDKPERMYAAAGLDAKGIVAKAIAALGDVERLASTRSA